MWLYSKIIIILKYFRNKITSLGILQLGLDKGSDSMFILQFIPMFQII